MWPSLAFLDSPVILKLGRLSLASEGKYQKRILETRTKKKMTQQREEKNPADRDIQGRTLLESNNAEKRWEITHKQANN